MYNLTAFRSHSHALNNSRIKILSFKEEIITRLYDEVKYCILRELNDNNKRKTILKNLLQQCCYYLKLENNGSVICSDQDHDKIAEILTESFPMALKIHSDQRLTEQKDIGGLKVVTQKGNIQCNNTIAQRIELSIRENMPLIRKMVFGDLKE